MNGGEETKGGALRYVATWDVLKRSSALAAVVGCLLSVTNQYDVILREPWSPRLGAKILMNFVLPFVVSSVSAAVNRPSR